MTFNFRDKPADRAAFADLYMERLAERGIEVIAVADHHSAYWLDIMGVAGQRAGIAVFPGVEVTTGSGSDGVHLVLIGDLDTSERDIDLLLAQVCGFDENASAGRSVASMADTAARFTVSADLLSNLLCEVQKCALMKTSPSWHVEVHHLDLLERRDAEK
jgi:hypothetical protein